MLEKVAEPDSSGRQLLIKASESLGLTARGYHRILRVARTLADLSGSDHIHRLHIAEALSHRRARKGLLHGTTRGQNSRKSKNSLYGG